MAASLVRHICVRFVPCCSRVCQVSAVPVLDYDDDRRLVGTISASDIGEVIMDDDFPQV